MNKQALITGLHLPSPASGESEARVAGALMHPLVNIGAGEAVTSRELAETGKDVVGHQGKIIFDTTQRDGTPRKLMDVGRLKVMGWKATTHHG